MDRYRSYRDGGLDDRSTPTGDTNFVGVNQYDSVEDIPPGQVQDAVNLDFTTKSAITRGGFVCIPELGSVPFQLNAVWQAETTPQDKTWKSVAFGNGKYVAVQDDGTGVYDLMYSPDGVTWTAVSTSFIADWTAVTYGNGKFVAVASASDNYTIGISDGDTMATSGGDDIIADTNARVMISYDGITWYEQSSAAPYAWSGVCYGASGFVAVANGDGGTTQAMTSSDGLTWTLRSTPASQSNHNWRSVAYGNGVYVAVASGGSGTGNKAMYSADGITWTASSTPSDPAGCVSVAYGNGTFVAVAAVSASNVLAAMTSTDGATWTARTTANDDWTAVTYGNAVFTAVGNSGVAANSVMTSTDGVTWTNATAASTNAWSGISFGNNTFVAVSSTGTGNQVMISEATSAVWASGVYSDPLDAGSQWIMVAGATDVGFYAFGKASRSVSLGANAISNQSTIVQCNNFVYIFRGPTLVPLYWDGDWDHSFEVVPETVPAAGFETIPYSNQATYYQNRLWVINGKDTVSASDVLDFTTYDALANEFNINTGSSDFLVTTYPFGVNSLVVFKNKSVMVLNNVDGSLTDVTATEITRQVGCVGINAVCSIGPDLAYVSNRNINLLSLTSTNNALQHKTLPLSTKIHKLMDRVNWNVAYKISIGYWDNKLYVALPLDNSTFCNTVAVYNFVTENWYGEWNFDASINMCIQGWAVSNYLGLQRLHAITEDGRIFVTDEGFNDISGSTLAEISASITTRAYQVDEKNTFQRRLFIDLYTWRPKFSVSSFSDGVSEESVLLTDQEYSRSESWRFNDSTYDLTNANDDYNRPYRKDYSTGPDSVQPQSGFLPEATQSLRIPLITRRQNRLSWMTVTNTQGYIQITTAGFENRPGTRSNLVQV